MTPIPVAISQRQTKWSRRLTFTTLRRWRLMCPKRIQPMGKALVRRMLIGTSQELKILIEKQSNGSCKLLHPPCHSNQRRAGFLIFPPASGVDGCCKNGGGETNVRAAVWGELLSSGGIAQWWSAVPMRTAWLEINCWATAAETKGFDWKQSSDGFFGKIPCGRNSICPL